MFRVVTTLFAFACLYGVTAPARAGVVDFSLTSCNCALDGFTGIIEGVAADGTSTPSDVVITGYNAAYFGANGGASPATPFSTATWTRQDDLVAFDGIPSYTVTLNNGVLETINISLSQDTSPYGSLALYYDGSLEYVYLQTAAVGPQQGFGQSTSTGPSTVYTYVGDVAVPEPASWMLLAGFALIGMTGMSLRRLR